MTAMDVLCVRVCVCACVQVCIVLKREQCGDRERRRSVWLIVGKMKKYDLESRREGTPYIK